MITKRITLSLSLNKDGGCDASFNKQGEYIIANIKKMKEAGEEFKLDSLNAVEKAFLCTINSLQGFAQIGQFEDE